MFLALAPQIYSMGANNLGQLGIGSHVINALQPMLVQALDGKNVTHMCAGQYHNAVVANGLLYTWGFVSFVVISWLMTNHSKNVLVGASSDSWATEPSRTVPSQRWWNSSGRRFASRLNLKIS